MTPLLGAIGAGFIAATTVLTLASYGGLPEQTPADWPFHNFLAAVAGSPLYRGPRPAARAILLLQWVFGSLLIVMAAHGTPVASLILLDTVIASCFVVEIFIVIVAASGPQLVTMVALYLFQALVWIGGAFAASRFPW